jgi:hypothetical protein
MPDRPWTGRVPWHGLWPPVLAIVLSVGMTWPVLLHLGSDIPQDLGDPLLSTWHLAWVGHAIVEQPFDLFQANIFWPEEDSLAFMDVLLGYAPAGVVAAQGPTSALVVYNLLFLFAYTLAFLGAFLLARELGAPHLGAAVAGAAFAYAPYRLAQDGHLTVLSSGGIPLALFLLVRGHRRSSGRLVFAGWLVTTWQVTLGFTLGVPLVYLVFAVGGVAAILWLRRGRPPLGRSAVAATAVGLPLLAVVAALQARPFFRVLDAHPEAERTPELVAFYSPPVRGFLAASQDSFLWSGPTSNVWDSLSVPGEQALFPGVGILVLAGLGLFGTAYPAAVRLWLAVGTALCAVLSLGLRDADHVTRGLTPYRLLYELGPGWEGLRAPGRLHTLTSLGLALLAAAGAALIVSEVRSRPLLRKSVVTAARRERAALLTAGLLTAVVLLEGLGPTQHPRVPPVPAGLVGARDPQLHLPSGAALHDVSYAYWSIVGFPKIANGYASITPRRLARIRRLAATFPDARSVAALRKLGLHTVVLHPDLAVGTPWDDAAERPTDELPLVREDTGGVILYHLAPAEERASR